MKWRAQKQGDIRCVTRFLLLPKEINGIVKWLEVASYKQRWVPPGYMDGAFWVDEEWIDK